MWARPLEHGEIGVKLCRTGHARWGKVCSNAYSPRRVQAAFSFTLSMSWPTQTALHIEERLPTLKRRVERDGGLQEKTEKITDLRRICPGLGRDGLCLWWRRHQDPRTRPLNYCVSDKHSLFDHGQGQAKQLWGLRRRLASRQGCDAQGTRARNTSRKQRCVFFVWRYVDKAKHQQDTKLPAIYFQR